MNYKYTLATLTLLSGLFATNLHAAQSIGYWYDSSGDIVHTNYGECWRTIHWSSSNAIAECEGTVAVKKVAMQSDQDADKDGVLDGSDACPDTEEDASVDNRGCVILEDTDGDGIADDNDDCSGTVSGTVVNKHGCKLEANIDLDNVQFKLGTSVLSDDSRATLDDVALTLNDNPHLEFIIAGHTDSMGNHDKNVALSKARANSVRQYLIGKGVTASHLTAEGYGPDKPVASNDTAAGRSQNRRVELVLK